MLLLINIRCLFSNSNNWWNILNLYFKSRWYIQLQSLLNWSEVLANLFHACSPNGPYFDFKTAALKRKAKYFDSIITRSQQAYIIYFTQIPNYVLHSCQLTSVVIQSWVRLCAMNSSILQFVYKMKSCLGGGNAYENTVILIRLIFYLNLFLSLSIQQGWSMIQQQIVTPKQCSDGLIFSKLGTLKMNLSQFDSTGFSYP